MNQQPSRSVALHIGAHKTATTHLQRSFVMQREALIKAGVRYYGPESLRRPQRGLGDIFGLDVYGKAPNPKRTPADQFEFMIKDGHRLILSDENFIGVMHDKDGTMLAPLYPQAKKRVAALVNAVAPHPVDMCLGIRNPASFLTSAYGQALIGGTRMPFETYLAKNPLTLVDWADLIGRLHSIPHLGRIFVWCFEEYRWRFYKASGVMMGLDANIRIAPFHEKLHVGQSQAAVDHVLSHASDVGEARAKFPVSQANPAFAPFGENQIALAQADYDRQIAQIEKMDGVTILRA
tara:strand:- start:97 stop:972 length:876 start_codon:yes stop_codon:yes gene_type:complete